MLHPRVTSSIHFEYLIIFNPKNKYFVATYIYTFLYKVLSILNRFNKVKLVQVCDKYVHFYDFEIKVDYEDWHLYI